MACVLDAYAIVALALDEPAAGKVEQLLHSDEGSRLSAANLAEAAERLWRVKGFDPEELRRGFDVLASEVVEVVSVGYALAWRAAELRNRHYRRKDSALSLADCIALATAIEGGHRLATGDPPLLAAARAEGIDVVELK